MAEDPGERWRARALALAATAVALGLQVAPILAHPTSTALGAPAGEGMAHLWGLATAAAGLPDHGPFLRVSTLAAFPEGVRLDLVDPAHLLVLAPLWWAAGLPGAAAGWNLLAPLHLLLLAGGTWLLARRLSPVPMVAALATAGAVATPSWWGMLPLGRSELLGLGLIPLVLALLDRALLHRALLDPSLALPARRRAGALAILTLVLLAHCGWQPLMQAGLILAPATLVLARVRRVPVRWLVPGLAAVLLPAAALCLPMLVVQLQTHPWWLARAGGLAVLGADAPAVDLLGTLRLAGLRPFLATAVPPYPGLVATLLCGLALRRQPHRAWALLALGLLLLGLGPRVQLGPDAVARIGPAWLLAKLVPPLGGLSDWGRLALGAGPLLALAGALGLSPWLSGRRGALLAAGLAALLLLDGLSYRPDAPGRFEVAPPAALVAVYQALPAGPVLELPGIAPDERAAQEDNDRSLLWTLSHGHPVQAAPSPASGDLLRRSLLLRVHKDVRPHADACTRTEGARLHAMGFRSVLLLGDRLEPGQAGPVEAAVARVLGPPAGQDGPTWWWTLRGGPLGPPACRAP